MPLSRSAPADCHFARFIHTPPPAWRHRLFRRHIILIFHLPPCLRLAFDADIATLAITPFSPPPRCHFAAAIFAAARAACRSLCSMLRLPLLIDYVDAPLPSMRFSHYHHAARH
jgi:hypothetical protein